MSYIVLNFECPSCETAWDDLVDKADRRSECPSCGAESTRTLLSYPNIASFSAKPREEQIASLKKRSKDHSKKLMKQNADKFFPSRK